MYFSIRKICTKRPDTGLSSQIILIESRGRRLSGDNRWLDHEPI